MIEEGDTILIDIAERRLELVLPEDELAKRRTAMEARGAKAWKPTRDRTVTPALRAYAAMTTSAARGAVRDVTQIEG